MKKWAYALTAIFFLITGCSQKDSTKEPVVKKEKPTVTETQTKEEEQKPVLNTYPLTGISTEANTEGRAVAVMVNNHPKARPQSGLNKADIVYEVLAEGDITRFLAVFQSEKPANIGPVRSARPYYIEIAKGLNAFYVAHGYSGAAKKLLDANYIDNINGMVYDGTLFKRSSARKPPHNSYITFENVLKGAELKKYSMDIDPPRFTFMTEEESQNITGNDAASVMISYSKSGLFDSTFEYDPASGKYKRFSGGEQSVDLDSKEPVLIDNVFIVEAVHTIIDSYGLREIDLKSGGRAYLIQKGKVNEVSWKNDNGRIIPVKNGVEVPFVPGKTWVNVVPTNPGLEQSVSFDAK